MSRSDLTPDQQELAEALSKISSRTYRATWMEGIESEVWRAVVASELGRVPLQLTAEEIDRLRVLSDRCGGWIRYDQIREETFVPMADWQANHTA
ncbi:MAG: hypothetical protein J7598_10740 [Mitsuaria chitosanitabida]|uniref:hypothetical protein n=1 Tax=Roseateles chitosanitabidus TaxID=65048 RepID=UPI001B2F68D0|nr:hypothetical protein [Roseateles chitosanitabidus]MBO9687082.1 hypothetical protein [Roseateles chitosanitabidus]